MADVLAADGVPAPEPASAESVDEPVPAPVPASAPMPTLARAFIGLAVVAVLVRTIVGAMQYLFTSDGGGIFDSPFRIDDLPILLPAVLVLRRRTAAEDTPWTVRGAVVLAIATFIVGPLAPLIHPMFSIDAPFRPANIALVENLAIAAGWIVLGYGLGLLNPPEPRPVIAGLANVIAGSFVVAGLVWLVGTLLFLATQKLFSNLDVGASLLSVAAVVVVLVGYGFFGRNVIRSVDDPSRPERATRTATAAVVLLAVGELLGAVLSEIEEVTGLRTVPTELFQAFGVGADIALVLLVVAFAMGLADPLRPMAGAWQAAAEAAPPS